MLLDLPQDVLRLGLTVLEQHSEKSPDERKHASEVFRDAKNIIMFTSDISARGLDYPDVTKVQLLCVYDQYMQVIQVGLSSNREQYIHRLGRTARAGKAGTGLSILSQFEEPWLEKVALLLSHPSLTPL